MTVNELITELQVLSAQGHGELDVTIYKLDDGHNVIKDSPFVMEGIKYESHYNSNPLSPRETCPFVELNLFGYSL